MDEVIEFAETTPLLGISFAPFYLVLAISFTLYALILLVEAAMLLKQEHIPLIFDDIKLKHKGGDDD